MEAKIKKIQNSMNEKFADSIHEVSVDATVFLSVKFKCFYVCIIIPRKRGIQECD